VSRGTWSQAFEPETASVRAARRFVLATPAAAKVDEPTLELMVSELVSNVVLHARTPFVVTIAELRDGIRVSVSDGDQRLPRQVPAEAVGVTGRGLGIIESLARRWSAEPFAEGKTVWFELAGVGA
jgi:anti-sigma regulatory factor (Ser/Thr protein kinase)